jgi:hypothetical protein
MTIQAARYNLKIYQGADIDEIFTFADFDFSVPGWTARSQARAEYDSAETIFDITTENGGITLADDGSCSLFVSGDDTADFTDINGVWDLELIDPDGKIYKPLRGTTTLFLEVTR